MLLDILGAATSLLSTYLFIRLNKAAWVVSLFATLMNGWLYWQKGIYADTLLEVFYFLTTCYGWLLWRKPTAQVNSSGISRLSKSQWYLLVAVIFTFFFIIANLLKQFTSTNVANLDALTTALSLVAEWLMCHKSIATWILWFITDAIYAYLYYIKQLPFHTLLMIIYTGMAISGYWIWNKKLEQQESIASKIAVKDAGISIAQGSSRT